MALVHNIHMKRTNLVLDEHLLQTATRLLGARTYSEAVNKALKDSIDLIQARGVLSFLGKGVWEGDLSEMRDDKPVPGSKSKK